MTIDDNSHREVDRRGHRDAEGPTADYPPGTNRDLGKVQGRQREANGSGTWQRKQACGAGRRDEWRNLEGDRWWKIPGGRLSTPGEDVSSSRERER